MTKTEFLTAENIVYFVYFGVVRRAKVAKYVGETRLNLKLDKKERTGTW